MAWRGRVILLIAAAMAVSGACTTPAVPLPGRAELILGLTGIASVSTGDQHSCALRTDGTAVCWGSNRFGEFGDGHDGIPTYTLTPTPVTGLTHAVSLSTGLDHTCAVLSDGTAWCWGANAQGQLGNDTLSSSLLPTKVTGLTNAVAIAAGGHYTCALLVDGHVECWGANTYGQLGIGSVVDSSTPTTVDGVDDAIAISVGTWTACAVRASGSVECWGYGGLFGQLGDGTTGTGAYSSDPVAVADLTGAVSVAVRSQSGIDDGNVCAGRDDGTVWCWGERILGDGTNNDSPIPVEVADLDDAVSVSGSSVLCALRASGTVQCWGDGTPYGLLGNGHTVPSYTPIDVHHVGFDMPSGALALSTGTNSFETCAVLGDRRVMCWGIIGPPGYPT
jgi:alpha-tubulin suppressor-like RCC1 family protein